MGGLSTIHSYMKNSDRLKRMRDLLETLETLSPTWLDMGPRALELEVSRVASILSNPPAFEPSGLELPGELRNLDGEGFAYRPESSRASAHLRWMTDGLLITSPEALKGFRASFGWE